MRTKSRLSLRNFLKSLSLSLSVWFDLIRRTLSVSLLVSVKFQRLFVLNCCGRFYLKVGKEKGVL